MFGEPVEGLHERVYTHKIYEREGTTGIGREAPRQNRAEVTVEFGPDYAFFKTAYGFDGLPIQQPRLYLVQRWLIGRNGEQIR